MNMETTVVKRYRNEFLVSDIEDLYIRVSARQVEQITQKVPDVEESEIAILLATITEARIMPQWPELGRKGYKEMEDEVMINGITDLLQHYDIDTLNSIFEEMKYYEIEKVLESNSPISALRDCI